MAHHKKNQQTLYIVAILAYSYGYNKSSVLLKKKKNIFNCMHRRNFDIAIGCSLLHSIIQKSLMTTEPLGHDDQILFFFFFFEPIHQVKTDCSQNCLADTHTDTLLAHQAQPQL